MSISEKLTQIAENEQKVHDAGRQTEQQDFWDNFQNFGNRTYYQNAFYQTAQTTGGWTDETYNPKYPIVCNGTSANCFYYSKIKDAKVEIIMNVVNSIMNGNFFGNSAVQRIPLLTFTETCKINNSFFTNANNLSDLTIGGTIADNFNTQWCPLNKKSIQSVLDHLSRTTTGLTCTFKKTAKESNFTEDEWVTAIAGLSNWSFSFI